MTHTYSHSSAQKQLKALFQPYEQALKAAPEVVVGFSGGLDSTVLLAAAATVVDPQKLRAIHINHQLQTEADVWQTHCEGFAAQLGVEIVVEKILIDNPNSGGVEARARAARYEVFSRHVLPKGILLLGHHADDQAETLLFRLFRGSGIKGLGAIPRQRTLSQRATSNAIVSDATLLRPLLDIPKRTLASLAKQNEFEWVDDPSNQQSRYDRNFLRNDVLPLIRSRWKNIDRTLLASAEMFRETDELLASIADADLTLSDLRTEGVGTSIDLHQLNDLGRARRHNALRRWIYLETGKQVASTVLNAIDTDLFSAAGDAQPEIGVQSHRLRRFQGRVFLLPMLPSASLLDEALPMDWHSSKPLQVERFWRLEQVQGAPGCFNVQRRQGGERLKPNNRAHSQQLKKVMQEANIVPWLRELLPIVSHGDHIIAVGDNIICGDRQFRLNWLIEEPTPFR